jgi:hypothetical protein
MSENQKLKPFDLEKALAGEPVVTRDGINVEEIFYFAKALHVRRKLCSIFGGRYYFYEENGKYLQDQDYCLDLFMAPKKKKLYIAIKKIKDSDQPITHRSSSAYEEEWRVRELFKEELSDETWSIHEFEIEV